MSNSSHSTVTPWSSLTGVNAVTVEPYAGPLHATVQIAGSKSVSNRALILAAMSEGTTRLTGLLRSDDTYWCAEALRALGCDVTIDDVSVTIKGVGRMRPDTAQMHVGSAGTIARFLPPVLAAGDPGQFTLTASEQMMRRPVGPLFDAMRTLGAEIETPGAENCYPALIQGGTLIGGSVEMSGSVSSQFISGMLMGGPLMRDGLNLAIEGSIVQSDYVRITLDMMSHFGVDVAVSDDFKRFDVAPRAYRAKDLAVEADASTATYFAAFAAVTGGRVRLDGVTPNTRQPDYAFLEILEQVGCTVDRQSDHAIVEGVAGKLKGGMTIDMRPLSDASLTLAAIAPFADGPITIANVAHIRHHESDRISAMCASLTKMGIRVDEHEDGMTVYPGEPQFAELETYEDHRIAMALSVAALAGNGATLLDPGCVSKTCPAFFDILASIGISTRQS